MYGISLNHIRAQQPRQIFGRSDPCVINEQPDRQHNRTDQHGTHIPAGLLIAVEFLRLATHKIDDLSKVYTRQQHEHRHRILYSRTVTHERKILGGEATGSHSSHRVAYAVEHIHAEEVQQQRFDHGQEDIRSPQQPCCIVDARRQFLVRHTRHLGGIELHSAQAEPRQDSHTQHNDSHTSQPLADSPP